MVGQGGVDVEVGVDGLHVREAHVDDVRRQDVPIRLKLNTFCILKSIKILLQHNPFVCRYGCRMDVFACNECLSPEQ